jgi:hypothetical protein
VVDGARHVGEQVGVAVAVAGDQRADLDSARGLGPGAQHRPALEVLAVALAVEREEVVPVEDDVHARGRGGGHGRADLLVVGVLWLQLDPDPDGTAHASDPRSIVTQGWRGRAAFAAVTAAEHLRHPDEIRRRECWDGRWTTWPTTTSRRSG